MRSVPDLKLKQSSTRREELNLNKLIYHKFSQLSMYTHLSYLLQIITWLLKCFTTAKERKSSSFTQLT